VSDAALQENERQRSEPMLKNVNVKGANLSNRRQSRRATLVGCIGWWLVSDRQARSFRQSQGEHRQRTVVADLLSESESCTCFVRECVERERGATLTAEEAYPAYVRFCSARVWPPLPPRDGAGERSAVRDVLQPRPCHRDYVAPDLVFALPVNWRAQVDRENIRGPRS
jgi:hypothetical protein